MPEWLQPMQLMQQYLIPWGLDIGLALLIVVAGWAVLRLAVTALQRLMRRTDPMLTRFVVSIFKALLWLVVVIAALDRLGLNTTSLVAVLGAAGLAIGLSLQDSLKSFAAGVMLILFRPFRIDDYVEVAGIAGVVESIGVFSTTLRTPDNRQIMAPNASIYAAAIVNYSARETRRIDLLIGIGYDDDLRKAKAILEGILAQDERVLEEPEPLVAVAALAENSVDLHVRPWVRSQDYFSTSCALNERIKLAFDDAGISIPYPQRRVHLVREAD